MKKLWSFLRFFFWLSLAYLSGEVVVRVLIWRQRSYQLPMALLWIVVALNLYFIFFKLKKKCTS